MCGIRHVDALPESYAGTPFGASQTPFREPPHHDMFRPVSLCEHGLHASGHRHLVNQDLVALGRDRFESFREGPPIAKTRAGPGGGVNNRLSEPRTVIATPPPISPVPR